MAVAAVTELAHSKSWSPPKRATDVDNHIAKRLKAARNLAGLSQTAAADVIGVTFQQLQKYEKGANRVSCGTMAKLADAYKKPVAWFFDGAVVNRDPEQDICTELMASAQGAEIAGYFLAIDDPQARRALLDIAAALAKVEGA